jgi:type III pantothenate kinase
LPFINKYETIQTLGNDRIGAVAGAQFLYPKENILIIDAGTAITYDILIGNEYLGGNISAGLNMRLKALHHFTSSLPLVELEDEIEFWGNNTGAAILSGVVNGIIFEIEGYIEYFKKRGEKNITIITGGDANYLVKKIKQPIFAVPNLVLIGLNRILEYNEE